MPKFELKIKMFNRTGRNDLVIKKLLTMQFDITW